MLETIISSTTTDGSIAFGSLSVIMALAIILGIVISLVYITTNKKNGYSSGFATTLIMLPIIIAIIILLVGNNVARAFSLAGAFSIIRFRSAPGEPRDIAYVFFTLAVGLASGMGYVGYAAMFTALLCSIMIILDKINYAKPKNKNMQLKIIVPEDLNYEEAFEDILDKYTLSSSIQNIKTRDFGSLFELNYSISMREETDKRAFIDELRCRNGNLNIVLTIAALEEKTFG